MILNKEPVTFWDSIEKPYQMGGQKHRIYLLDLLKYKGVSQLFDVGCGTAPIFDMIVNSEEGRWDNIKKYKGTDYSEDMIACCTQMFPYGKFEVEDARHLTEADNSWECVLLLHSLDHIKQYDEVIKEAARVSSKYILIVLWRAFAPEGVHVNDRNMIAKKEGEEPWEDTYLVQYSAQALTEEFKKNGLKVEEIAEGIDLNSDQSKYNFLYLLRKENT